jgi:DNA-binding HxlR family transcriptional regulator
MAENNSQKTPHVCTLKDVLDVIGGKWAMPIIYNLSKGTMRFKEIESTIEGINTRMLVKELKNLEANGIVTREVFASVPPKVEYTLTKKGDELLPSIKSLHRWGLDYAV